MTRTVFYLALTSWLTFSVPGWAHVSYIDLSNPAISPGGVNGASFENYGWFDGTRATLGDSHHLAGATLFSFHLDHDSYVSITFSDTGSTGLLNPGFSVYRGLLPDEAHDNANFDPLNPAHFDPGPPPHAVKDPSPVDNGVTADAYGRISPFRDTVNITFVGQFDALHTWSMANESSEWAVIQYMAHASPTGGNSVSLTNLLLAAGDFTIAAGGGVDCAGNPGCYISNIDGTVAFSATVAPDGDSDGRADGLDNCRLISNNDPGTVPNSNSVPKAQLDADHDGYGNICDADINNSNFVTTADYTRLRNVLNRPYNYNADAAAADMNGSGMVTAADYTLLRNRLNTTPGPSGLACAGTVPCP